MKVPTIQDVAREAQVSAATVSRVLSSPERVSETTRERVVAAVQSTGYTLNQAARSLRMKAARTILIALPNIGNPFYSTILESVVQEASARGYGVLVASRLGEDPTRWLGEYFLSNRADGMLLFDGSLDTRAINALPFPGGRLPLVAAFDELPEPDVHSVSSDNRRAAIRAVELLVSLGHRRIGHIAAPSRNGSPNERLIGYERAIAAAGLPVRPDWILIGDYSMPSGAEAARHFLALSDRPTAMFVANDEMAIGFLSVLREHGIECPRDISVVSFDDINIARFFSPPLTTIRQPREEIGRVATSTLVDLIEQGDAERPPIRIELRSELIQRESTAAAGRPHPKRVLAESATGN